MFDPLYTNIPFKVGQSSIHGADCLGLVILHLRNQGFRCLWEPTIQRGKANYEYFKAKMEENGAMLDASGDIFLQRFIPYGHMGLVIGEKYVYQSNITLKTEVEDIPGNGYIYKYFGE